MNFIQTRHRSSADGFSDRKTKKFARRTSPENDSTSEEFGSEGEEEEPHHIYRAPVTGKQRRKPKDNGLKKGVSALPEPSQSESLKVITAAKEMMQTFMDKM